MALQIKALSPSQCRTFSNLPTVTC